MRTNFYVDGFNLYYGAVKRTPYKWLDLSKLFALLLPNNQIHRIRYFTAKVRPQNPDFQQPQRQAVYLRALETIPNLSIHYGRFLTSQARMPLVSNPATMVDVVKTEEKGSDVNIATYLLLDAFDRDYDIAVLVSNDSDLVHTVQIIRERFGLTVGVLNPQRDQISWALRNAANFYRPIRRGVLAQSQFPPTLHDAHGNITKPATW